MMRMYPAKEGRKEGREREGGNKGRKDTKMRLNKLPVFVSNRRQTKHENK